MTEIYLKDYLSETAFELIKDRAYWKINKNSDLPWDDSSYQLAESDYSGSWRCNVVHAHKGDVLVTIMLSDSNEDSNVGIFSFTIQAQREGFYVTTYPLQYNNWKHTYWDKAEEIINGIKFLAFETIDEWEDYYFSNIQKYSSLVDEDLFEGKKVIKWNQGNREQNEFAFSLNASDSIFIETSELGVFLKYYWNSSVRRKSESGVGDTIVLLLDNKEQISFVAKDYPVKSGKKFFYQFQITQDIIDKLCSHTICAIKKTFANGDEPQKLVCTPYCTIIFRIWLKKHMQICEQLGYRPNDEIEEEIKTEANCFVYLMLDEINGYYKIGISNNPKYRERTLQSEKPSIKLICAKEFTSRRIAEAIESALHKAYTAEHLRGEWFNLTAKDVQEITQTLA